MTAPVASFRRKVQATLCLWETGLPRTSLDVGGGGVSIKYAYTYVDTFRT